MAKYLYMDGVDDWLEIPEMDMEVGFIELDVLIEEEKGTIIQLPYYVWSMYWRSWSGSWGSEDGDALIQVDGVPVEGQPYGYKLPIKKRILIEVESFNYGAFGEIYFFTPEPYSDSSDIARGRIYDIKLYDHFHNLQAHYNMSTGTVLDQSGNGNHATLNGGTWVDREPGDSGLEITESYTTKQAIYSNTTVNNMFLQRLFDTKQMQSDTLQLLYRNEQISHDLKQRLTADRQSISDTLQSIYANRINNYDTLQTIFEQAVLIKDYDLKIIINKLVDQGYDLKHFMTAKRRDNYDLLQSVFADIKNNHDTKLMLYEQTISAFDMLQEIYDQSVVRIENYAMKIVINKESTAEFETRQLVYDTVKGYTNLKQVISRLDMLNVNTRQVINEQINKQMNTLQVLFSARQVDYDTLIRLRDDLFDIIGAIYLKAKRDLNVYLKADQKLYAELIAKRELFIHLKGAVNMTMENQNFSMYAGDSKYIKFPVEGVEDLNATTLKWGIRKSKYSDDNTLVKETGDGISIVDGEVQIKLDPADTEKIQGKYFQECELTDSASNVSTVLVGEITINRSSV